VGVVDRAVVEAKALMPGPSGRQVTQSVPTIDWLQAPRERCSPAAGRGSSSAKLYVTAPASHSCVVCATPKSWVKSLPQEDAQGKLQPIRRWYAWIFASQARDTVVSVMSWWARWATDPLKPSAIAEQVGHPAV
jgi:hypothetical protein